MANEKNLIPFTSSQSREEAVKNGRKGGRRSGEARRRKADFRKTLNLLLTAEIDNPEWTPFLEALGLDSTLESAVNAAMIREALSGNVKAYEAVAKYSGQGTGTDADMEEQRIRTDRAKRARDQEVGDTGSDDENIRSFLKAMNPTQEDIDALFNDSQEEGEKDDGNESPEETGEV